MRSLIRTARPAQVVVTQLAAEEQQAWEAERQQRFTQRPVGQQPHWVDLTAAWTR